MPRAPDLVGIVARPEGRYWLQLEVSSDGIIYSYDPSQGLLLATNANGYVLWQKELAINLFIQDLKLNAAEDRLIASFIGGEVGSFYLDGKQQWLLEYPEYQAQRIELGNTAIIVYLDYDASEDFNANFNDRQVVSIGYDGQERWRYIADDPIESVFIGRDNLVYVRVRGERQRVFIFRQ